MGLSTDPTTFTRSDTKQYLNLILKETGTIQFTPVEARKRERESIGKLLRSNTRDFFLYHMSDLLVKAVTTFFKDTRTPAILDLGCGAGTASILFGLLGAKVIGLDLDPDLVNICRKRQTLYESLFGSMDAQFHCANIFEFPIEEISPFDGIYSLFAFNLMQPSTTLLARLIPILESRGKIVISDGNKSSLYNRLFRPRNVLTPTQMASVVTQKGCRILDTSFNCSLPPSVVCTPYLFPAGKVAEQALIKLKLAKWVSISYTLIAEKVYAADDVESPQLLPTDIVK